MVSNAAVCPILVPERGPSQRFPRGVHPGTGPDPTRRAGRRRFLRSIWLTSSVALACGVDPQARLDEIRTLQDGGDHAATIPPLRELLAETPDDPELNHLYGVALLRTRQPELAIWPLRKAAAHPDRALEDGLLLARAMLAGGSAEDAVEQAQRVLELAPDRVEVLRLLLEARVQARQNEEILADVDRLLALVPGDPAALTARLVALLNLERADDAEQALTALRAGIEASKDAEAWQPRLCAVTATFTQEKGDAAEAERLWDACLERFPGEDVVVFGAIDSFGDGARQPRVLEVLRRAHAANPTHLPFVEALANQLGAAGNPAEAERLLLAATRDGVNEGPAWLSLAQYHERRDETAAARDAMAQGLKLLGEAPPSLVAAYVDLLIRAGDYDEAEPLIGRFESEPVMWNLLRGRLLLARAKPVEALAAFDEGLRLWPDNSVARWLAAQAAEQLGDYERALTEYREAVRNDTGNRDAVLSLLRLLEASGEDQEGLAVLARYQGRKALDAELLVQTIRFAGRAGQWRAVQLALGRLAELPGQRAEAAVEFAAIQATRYGPASGVEAIREAKLDLTRPANEPALRALALHLIGAGRAHEAVAAVEAALAAHPDEAALHELRGRALRAAGDPGGARDALERALAIDAERAGALAELAALAEVQADRDAAIALYDRAARADPERTEHAWRAIQLVAASGDDAKLEPRLEALLAADGTHAGAASLLAQRLAERDPQRAASLAHRAVRFRGGPDALDTLGRIQLARGDAERAARTLARSLELRPDSPSTRYWMGVALAAKGDSEGARRALSDALVADAFPEREAAQAELARLGAN